jgi:hypothetical protein
MGMSARKDLVAAYRERKPPRGVLGIRHRATGRLFVDSAPDLEARWNRHRFQLDLGSHPNRALQADWKTFGPEAFSWEVLADLPYREEDREDTREALQALELLVLEETRPYGAAGYHGEGPPVSLR